MLPFPLRNSQPVQSRFCQNDPVISTVLKFFQPAVHISPDQNKVSLWTKPFSIKLPPQAARPDQSALRERREGLQSRIFTVSLKRCGGLFPVVRAAHGQHQHIPGIRPRQDGQNVQSLRQAHGQILCAVHGQIDPALQQGGFKLGNEYALLPHLGKGLVLHLISLCAENHRLRFQAGPGGTKRLFHKGCLRQSQAASPCADSQFFFHCFGRFHRFILSRVPEEALPEAPSVPRPSPENPSPRRR